MKKEAEKRANTPDRHRDRAESKQDLRIASDTMPMPVRGKSFEQQRAASGPAAIGQPSGATIAAAAAVAAQGPAVTSTSAHGSPTSRPTNGHDQGQE